MNFVVWKVNSKYHNPLHTSTHEKTFSKDLKKMTFLDTEMAQKIDVLIPWPKNIPDDDIKWRDSNCYEVWRQFYDRAEPSWL